jgi:hypothetical protein
MKKKPAEKGIPWHTAFFEAIQMELDEYSGDLQFISEFPLNTQPLKIDAVIIKKSRDIIIEKNIAAIFRRENIVEYKSPDDYISVGDFYKAFGCACLYSALNNVSIDDMTLTFVGSRYPRELLAHLRGARGYTVEEKAPGVYTVIGAILPVQIIDSRKLSGMENIWLKDLDNKLNPPELLRITAEIDRQGKEKAGRIMAYFDAVTRGNLEILKEVIKMSDCSIELEKIFEEVGWIAKWEARGIAKTNLEIAKKMKKMGDSVEKIQAITGLPAESIEKM